MPDLKWMNVTTPPYPAVEYPAGYCMGGMEIETRDSADVKAASKAAARRLAYPLLAKIRDGYVMTQRENGRCPFTGWEVYVYRDDEQEWIEDGAT